jgi:hypothetical protein
MVLKHGRKKMKLTMKAAAVLMIAASANAAGIMDTAQEITEHLWELEYIPDSGESVVPLSEYDHFDVVELFRAETIEELEAAITDGYPMPWLEEILKDESIPWEDRYWMDCQVRSNVAQNLHCFFSPNGAINYIRADAVFPGELFWKENFIVDPVGWNVDTELIRPVGSNEWDIGHIFNRYGRKIGELPFPIPQTSMSRDGSLAVMTTGHNSPLNPDAQSYACFMFQDGSFLEVPFEEPGMYSAVVAQDADIAVFACTRSHNSDYPGHTYVFNANGILRQSIVNPVPLQWCWLPTISSDGNRFCHIASSQNVCLYNLEQVSAEVIPKLEETSELVSSIFHFSPDGTILNIGGSTTGRALNLETRAVSIFNDTAAGSDNELQPTTVVCSSRKGLFTASATHRSSGDEFHNELRIYSDGVLVYDETIPPSGDERLPDLLTYMQADISPNGHFVFISPLDDYNGYPSEHGYQNVYNIPVIVMQLKDGN